MTLNVATSITPRIPCFKNEQGRVLRGSVLDGNYFSNRVSFRRQSTKLLKNLPKGHAESLVFPGKKDSKMLSDMSLTAVMRRMEIDAVPHGFRSTFRDWVGDRTSFSRDLAEMALAHVIASKTEEAYRRSDAIERRREMMNAWASFIES